MVRRAEDEELYLGHRHRLGGGGGSVVDFGGQGARDWHCGGGEVKLLSLKLTTIHFDYTRC